jgi:hypothetical protein
LCCNGNDIEFKTFKDVIGIPTIIDHLLSVPGRLSKYLMFFERKGSWDNLLSYRMAFVYDLECKEFVTVCKHYKKLEHMLFYVDSNLSRKCR